jgi:glutathione S-transferase
MDGHGLRRGASSVRLYHFPTSPNCLKVCAVAYEIGIELELATVNIFKGESGSAAFRALNPNGLVPVLVDGDFVLWESNAILTYLASNYGSLALISTDARRPADIDRWLHWESAFLSGLSLGRRPGCGGCSRATV